MTFRQNKHVDKKKINNEFVHQMFVSEMYVIMSKGNNTYMRLVPCCLLGHFSLKKENYFYMFLLCIS